MSRGNMVRYTREHIDRMLAEGKGKTDWAEVDALTEKELQEAALSDPDALPTTEEELERFRRGIDVKTLRRRLNLSQREFARTYHLSVRTLQEWEQRRIKPDVSATALLTAIANDPEGVKRALAKEERTAR